MAKGERSVRYKRILLKLSGEALAGADGFGISPQVLDRMALEIGQLVGIGDGRPARYLRVRLVQALMSVLGAEA